MEDGTTQTMTGATISFASHRHIAPSATALAARSRRLAEQLTDPDERAAAIRNHFSEFVAPATRSACSIRPA